MRIAQVAPLYESVPPQLYGGTERVVSYLTEALVEMGHEVTLFASGDSVTHAKLVAACPRSLWNSADCRETLPHHVRLMNMVFEDVSRFDVVHFHTDYLHFPLLREHMHLTEDPALRQEYRRRAKRALQKRVDGILLFGHLLKCAMYYHYFTMTKRMTDQQSPVVNSYQ